MTTNAVKIEFGFGAELAKDGTRLTSEIILPGLETIKRAALVSFEGYTLLRTDGGWLDRTYKPIEEKGFTLVANTKMKSPEQEQVIANMVRTIKGALRQEAVAVTITPVNFQIL